FNRSFEPEHLLGHRIVKDEIQSSISIDIRTNRGFISGILMDHVLAPVSRSAFRILIPDRFLPRLVDPDKIVPAILIDVKNIIYEGIAVAAICLKSDRRG